MTETKQQSLIRTFFLQLYKKKVTLFSLSLIVFLALISVFAYVVVPDHSPDANHQTPELGLLTAGTTKKVITLKKQDIDTEQGSWWSGYPNKTIEYPYDSIKLTANGALISINGRDKLISLDVLNENADMSKISTTPQLEKAVGKSRTYYLGTDKYGRDVLSRVVLGIRISLLAGFLAVIVSLLIGVLVGALGGYFGGWIDGLVMYFINVTWAIPTLLLVFAIVLALGRGMQVIFLAIGLTMWVDVARIVRGQVKEVKELLYVQAARSIGQTDMIIIFRHILPNIFGPVLVITAANFASAILIEAGLSYLGFGINPPTPSLGNMLNENYGYALSGNLTIALAPAVIVSLLVLAFNLLGSGLRDIFDVKSE